MQIGHFVDRYPLPEQGYIYDQILESRGRQDRLLCGRAVAEATAFQENFPVAAHRPLPHSRLGRLITPSIRHRATMRIAPDRWASDLSEFVVVEHRRSPFDVLHAHFGTAGSMLAGVREAVEVPLVTTFYGVDASACLHDPRWKAPYARLFACGDIFVVLSEEVRKRLCEAGAPADRVLVWNIGLELSTFTSLVRAPTAEPPGILCVARFVEKKGHGVLLKAFAALRAERAVRLTLIGYGPLKSEIHRQVRSLGLDSDVTIIDTAGRTDFMRLFCNAVSSHTVFALPAVTASDGDDEGGPALTVVYAQAAGMPVVVTAFPGAERSVLHADTGLLSEADPGALHEALQRVIDDHELACRLGRNASDLVQRQFSMERQRARLEQVYRNVMGRIGFNTKATEAVRRL